MQSFTLVYNVLNTKVVNQHKSCKKIKKETYYNEEL